MIEASLIFDGAAIFGVAAALKSLPGQLVPTSYSENEDSADKGISGDPADANFGRFVEQHPSGFFMTSPIATYNIRGAVGRDLICDAFLEVASPGASEFLAHMSSASPIFGYACDPREREFRNRISTTLGVNHIEAWVGRDVRRRLPGLYWLTLISGQLKELYRIDTSAMERAAVEYRFLAPDQHLFRFYEDPEGWRESTTVSKLMQTGLPIFNIDDVKCRLPEAKTYAEVADLLREER